MSSVQVRWVLSLSCAASESSNRTEHERLRSLNISRFANGFLPFPVPPTLMDPSTSNRNCVKNHDSPAPIPATQIPADLADKVKGMYRLLDLISESGSSGYSKNLP